MKAVIQRVKRARILNLNNTDINKGLVVLIGFEKDDDEEKIKKFIKKLINLRIFEDENGKMNISLSDINGEILIVPNFTLSGNISKGNRPSFDKAMEVEKARRFFEILKTNFLKEYLHVKFGEFQSYMEIEIINDGPITLIYEI
ncbi:MAG: D-aminoacyl-tRNA deacylase [candidate division WOR-3 bacterium]|nr:D-aminoacyl-tRNA deacylase [candidate division WOR-3 bacterium]MCX7947986.1 D-aminoacyl-tRNA deacylase [candidate division WOR-3 bacterium]MDW8151202.1 D-aminoacyl-tRNA deacylase [candidate division WOR-3 bacterium]